MDLRYRLAVVTDAGAGLGREVAVALSRVGAAVLCVDRDLTAADETTALVERARVKAWALQADPADEDDLRLLADRARDLGGMDLLVILGSSAAPARRLTQLFADGLAERHGRSDGSPAVVRVCGSTDAAGQDSGPVPGARVMAVVPGEASVSEVARTVVDLLARGTTGDVVDLTVSGRAPCPRRPRR